MHARPTTITHITAHDIRFPTSRTKAGSDAMNASSDYSAAYVILHTDSADHLQGHGLTFTNGRGNEMCVEAIKALCERFVIGRTLESITENFGAYWHEMVASDCQLRWLGPGGLLIFRRFILGQKAERRPIAQIKQQPGQTRGLLRASISLPQLRQ